MTDTPLPRKEPGQSITCAIRHVCVIADWWQPLSSARNTHTCVDASVYFGILSHLEEGSQTFSAVVARRIKSGKAGCMLSKLQLCQGVKEG